MFLEVLIVILPLALIISFAFLWSFIRAAQNGQFDDLETPANRILIDENKINTNYEETK